jgi:hypothetical protein
MRQTDDEGGSEAAPALPSSQFWQLQLELSAKEQLDFEKQGERIERRYRNERDDALKARRPKRFGILYSNTETYVAALYARTPKPDVRRRFSDRDKAARAAADVIERALSYCADNTKHDQALVRGVKDFLLPGRGVCRVCYEPQMGEQPVIGPDGQPVIREDGQPAMQEIIADQVWKIEHVYWRDFRHSPARCWNDVWWIAFRHRMTRGDLRDNGFEEAESVPLNWQPDVGNKSERNIGDDLKRAEVWEIWHKAKKQRLWVVNGHPRVLRVDADPYGLQGFWPMAEPLFAVSTNDTLLPAPDFLQYEDQADDLDDVTGRISVLTKALKRRGVYNSAVPELKRLARAGDNEFIASENYASLVSSGGLVQAFATEDIKPIAEVLLGLYKQRDFLLAAVYEVTGISDIMRGDSNANETATAQQLKSQFGSMRLKRRQREVQRWIRDLYRIKAELIAEHAQPQILKAMAGGSLPDKQQVEAAQAQIQQMQMQGQQQAMQAQQMGHNGGPPMAPPMQVPSDVRNMAQNVSFDDVFALIKDDKLRSCRIDIELDSTVFEDAEAEKNARIEVITAVGAFLQQAVPVTQAVPELQPLMFEMLALGIRAFKSGRSLEDTIDQVQEALRERAANPPAPQPDPAIMKVQAEMKRDEQSHQMDMQTKQLDQQGAVLDLQAHRARAQADIEKAQALSMFGSAGAPRGPQA